ncbi:hypothetical protein G6F56_005860 [Rhizopus delemar]|nr:hypothetical protein G6F56_005860 [Rhizopus delemar]
MKLLSDHFSPLDILPQLRVIKHQLSSLQQYRADTLALRASSRWREKGETSAGYLKCTIQQKARRKNIPCLRHPVTAVICHSKDGMLQATSLFYTSLYTPDPIEPEALGQLFSSLSPEFCISTVSKSNLALPFTLTDIDEAVRRCLQKSLPGSDGLPYMILSVLLDIPACQSVFLQVLNGALTDGILPPSWSDTRVSLLPKKGNHSDLRNWRPIPLINTDAKVFTHLLNARILTAVSDLITPFQTGFMHDRFIADNGLLMKLIMDHCSRIDSSAVEQVRSCVSKFVTSGIFPRLSFDTMHLPRTFGGLGVLDPSVQQRALQIRWLIPLLQPTHSPSSPLRVLRRSVVPPHLAHFVLTHSCPPSVNTLSWDYHLPFLFPELRGLLLSQSHLSLSLLFSAVDKLPQNWSHVVINQVTVLSLSLSLPVMALTLTPSSTMVPKSFRKLRGHDAFIIDDGAILRARLRSEMVCFPNLSKKFLNLVSGLHLSLAPFFLHTFLTASSASMAIPAFVPASCSFVDVTPFVYALFGLPPSGMQVHNLSPVTRRPFDSRYYRHLYLAPLLKTMSTIISWSSFWSFSMVHSARNVWYRVLHQKIPCRAFLHRIDLSSVPDGACLLCGQPETSEHLIILCPRKTPFWSSICSIIFFLPSA